MIGNNELGEAFKDIMQTKLTTLILSIVCDIT